VEISIDVEDVAESDISLTEYANRYLSQKGNVGRKNKGGDAVHPKFAIALAATQAKTSKSGRGSSSNSFAAFADADENNDESAVAEEDDDDGWNTVPARNHVPTHPWHRAAARKSFGADHHRPSFNSSNKTTGVYFDARRCERRPSLTRDDVNRYFEPAKSSKFHRETRRDSDGRLNSNNRHAKAGTTQEIEWAAVDTSKALSSFSIGASHARETSQFEEWKKRNHEIKSVDMETRYPEDKSGGNISPVVSPLSGGFATVAPMAPMATVAPLTPPGLSRDDIPVEDGGAVSRGGAGLGILQAAPLSPPFERTHAAESGMSGKPNYFASEMANTSTCTGSPVAHVQGFASPPMAHVPGPSMRGLGSPIQVAVPSMGSPHPRIAPHPGMAPGPGMASGPGMRPMAPMAPPGPYFAVVLPPEICDQIRRGLLPPPPPPPPMHMMWRGGPLPPGVGIPVPVMPW
jgi:hypothetical protein